MKSFGGRGGRGTFANRPKMPIPSPRSDEDFPPAAAGAEVRVRYAADGESCAATSVPVAGIRPASMQAMVASRRVPTARSALALRRICSRSTGSIDGVQHASMMTASGNFRRMRRTAKRMWAGLLTSR
jgi:hypothetical protein